MDAADDQDEVVTADPGPAGDRLRVEEAVVQVSLLLASTREVEYNHLLRILGEGTGAECVYLQRVPPDNRPLGSTELSSGESNILYWTREAPPTSGTLAAERGHARRRANSQNEPEAGEGVTLERLLADKDVQAVPILSAEDTFYGYLGIAYDHRVGQPSEGERILSVVGDMLASYLERRKAEEALGESEQRYRNLAENHPDPILITTRSDIAYVNPAGCTLFGVETPEQVTGRSLFDFVSAEDHASVDERLTEVFEGKPADSLRLEVSRLDGEWRIVELFAVPVLHDGMPAAQVVLRDITERQKSEERYRTFVETISEGIWHVMLEEPVSTTAAPEYVAAHVARHGVLIECNRSMAQMLGAVRPDSLVGRPFWVTARSTGFSEDLARSSYRVHNWATSLVRGGEERHFVLNASGILERDYLVGVWGSCTDVTENVQLERHMVSMLEEQQQQIGRELHDGVGQYLTGVRMLSQVLAESYTTTETEEAQLAHKIMRFAENAAQQVRGIYYGLTPAQLSMDGLAPALEELAVNTDMLPNIRCRFVHDGAADVSEREAKLHMYRIAQEAVNNALKHARARSITVAFRLVSGAVELEIQDDGVGLDLQRRSNKSLGIHSMYYRARSVGAELRIDTKPGRGTVITCSLPLRTS